jgi:hypothetical protein
MSIKENECKELIINTLYHPEIYFIVLIVYGNKLKIPINLHSLLDLNRLLYSKYKLVLDNPQFNQVAENDIFKILDDIIHPISEYDKLYHQEFEKIYKKPVHLHSNYIRFLFQQMYYGNGINILQNIFIQDGFVVLIDDKNVPHVYVENIKYFTKWLNVYNP